ncbi:MAG: tetratricopeptide repeat protein, partial [Burkholderiaceae bacterium]
EGSGDPPAANALPAIDETARVAATMRVFIGNSFMWISSLNFPDKRLTAMLAMSLAALLTLTGIAQPVFPELRSRAEAIAALEQPDPRQRAAGVIYIARTGLPPDGPLLVRRLSDESPVVRELAEAGAWQVWTRSGDTETDKLLAAGSQQMSAGQLQPAIATFGRVIRRQPAFAEGWNKRATAYFLAGDFQKSLADCAEVIKRNPQHFGALSGYGQIYFQLEDFDKSLEYFRRALAVNPNMSGVEINIRAIEELLRDKRRKMI